MKYIHVFIFSSEKYGKVDTKLYDHKFPQSALTIMIDQNVLQLNPTLNKNLFSLWIKVDSI